MALVLVGQLDISGVTTCPAPSDVREAVLRIVGEGVVPASGRFRIEQRGEALHLEMLDGAGAQLVERTLPAHGDCGANRQAAAVVIASWLAAVPAEDPAPPQLTTVKPQSPAPSLEWELAGGVSAAWADAPTQAFAGAAMVSAGRGTPGRGFGLALELSGQTPRAQPLGNGQVSWERLGLALAVRYRLMAEPVSFDLLLRGRGGLLFTQGSGFATNSSAAGLDWGLGGGVHAGFNLGRVVPWLGVDLGAWLRRQVVAASGVTDPVIVPNVELLVTAGVRWPL